MFMNETIKNLAIKANMTESEVEQLYIKTKDEYVGRGIPEDKLESVVMARMQTFLKKKFAVTGSDGVKVPAMFLGVNNTKDWAKFHVDKIKKDIANMSKTEAINKGYINEKGEYLYQNGNNQGKPIPEKSWQGTAFGIIEYKDEVRFTTFRLYGDPAEKGLPLFKACTAMVKLQDKAPEGEFAVTMNSMPFDVPDAYVNYHEYSPFVTKTRKNQVITPLKKIEEFAHEMSDSGENDKIYGNWAIVKGNIVKLIPARNGSIGVVIDDDSLNLDSDKDEVKTYTIWFGKEFDIDFVEDAIDVTFVVNTRIGRDNGKVMLNGMGYWVDEWFRKQGTPETPDPQAPWG